jgi:hypothetical protein
VRVHRLLTLTQPFFSEHLGTIVRKVESGDYDETALRTCAHPPELRRLASRDCLLNADPEKRMRLDELIESLAAQGGAGEGVECARVG